jgi:hypothetical protein
VLLYVLAMTWTAAFALTLAVLFAVLVVTSMLLGIAPRAVRRLLITAGFPPFDSRP